MFRRAGKLVLTVDYVPSGILRKRAFSLSRALGFIPFAAGKKLDKLEKIQK